MAEWLQKTGVWRCSREWWESTPGVTSDGSGAQETPAPSSAITFTLFLKTTPCQIWATWPCWRSEVLIRRSPWNMKQHIQSLHAVITLTIVTLFHFYLTTDLHSTMHPADVKPFLSFLHGWWTPTCPLHPAQTQEGAECGDCHSLPLLFLKLTVDSSIIHTLNNVVLRLCPSLSWPAILIWRLSNGRVNERWQDFKRASLPLFLHV